MAKLNPVFVQMIIFQCFGFLPLHCGSQSHRWHRMLQPLLTFIAVIFVLGSLACGMLQWAISLWHILHPAHTHGEGMLLVNIFALLPYCVFIVRAVFVLMILFWKRQSWKNLYQAVQLFIKTNFLHENIRQKLLIKWRGWSVLFLILTVTFHVSWDIFHWHESMEEQPEMKMMSDQHVMGSLPIKIVTWKFLIFWELFSSISFILSQQVLVSVIIFAMIVADSLKSLNGEIHEETLSQEHGRLPLVSVGNMTEVPSQKNETAAPFLLEEKVRIWKKLHTESLRLCEEINDYFGLILFTIYGLDFVAVLAFGANVLINSKGTIDSYVYYIFSFLLFASYGTLFLIPLVICHEQSVQISYNLHQLSNIRDQQTGPFVTTMDKKVMKNLLTFEAASRHHLCLINGCEVLHFTRGFVLGTCTLAFSLLVLAKELLDREKEAGHKMVEMMMHVMNVNSTN